MKIHLENVTPADIERRSMEIISDELERLGISINGRQAPVVKRAIHASADFDYAKNLYFSDGAIERAVSLIKKGACIVTDTSMVRAGINKKAASLFGGEVLNFVADGDVADFAKKNNMTRSAACVDKAAKLGRPVILAVGNAPTALIRAYELYSEGAFFPGLIIGAAVGFVNVIQAKELIMQTDIPCIIARGQKGGSGVCAAICNALLYMCVPS